MDLTIVIPTINRCSYVKKLLRYYEKQNFKGCVIIIDSSIGKNFKLTSNKVKISRLKVSHKYFAGDPFTCMKYALPLIKTKYAAHSGDDDYYSVKGIKKIIKTLDKNSKYTSAFGDSVAVGVNDDKNEISGSSIYRMPYSEQLLLRNRLNQVPRNSQLPIYAIFRTEKFKILYNSLLTNQNKNRKQILSYLNEHMIRLLPAILGPSTKVKIFFLVRFVTNQQYKMGNINFKKEHKEFNKLQNLCIKKIGSLIKDKKNFIIAKKKMNTFKQDIVRPRNIPLSIRYFFLRNLALCKGLLDLVYYGGRIHNKYLDKNSKNYSFEFVKITNTFLNE